MFATKMLCIQNVKHMKCFPMFVSILRIDFEMPEIHRESNLSMNLNKERIIYEKPKKALTTSE